MQKQPVSNAAATLYICSTILCKSSASSLDCLVVVILAQASSIMVCSCKYLPAQPAESDTSYCRTFRSGDLQAKEELTIGYESSEIVETSGEGPHVS
jgi:hypothetical protein